MAYYPVDFFSLFLYDSGVFLIRFKLRTISGVCTDPVICAASEELPRIYYLFQRMALTLRGGYNNREHIQALKPGLVRIKPARIKEGLHKSADTEPLHAYGKDYGVCILKGIGEHGYPVFLLIKIVS